MEPLHTRRCEPCRTDSPPLSNEQAQELLTSISGWDIEQQGTVYRLNKSFRFNSFRQAFEFATKIKDIAEQENHHPVITVEWGKATIQWWTHSIAGLHLNDFIMAAKTDESAGQ